MLRLVDPPSGGKEPIRPPKGCRSPALRLTDVEAMHLRAALRGLRALHGGWKQLAEAIGVKPSLLHAINCGQKHPSPAVALLASRVARTTVDRVLSGEPRDAGVCPHCGRGGT